MSSSLAPRRYDSRTLLTLAAIGVALGIVTAPITWVSQVLWVGIPILYGVTIVPYALCGVIALTVVRRGGSALIAGVIAGLVSFPFTGNIGIVAVFLFVAVFQELPYLLTAWRRWTAGAAFAGAAFLSVAYALFWWFTLDAGTFPPLVRAGAIGVLVAGVFAATALGLVVGRALLRTGVGRRR